jgi:RNA polymerase sigma-70 factor (ECF subfamily)
MTVRMAVSDAQLIGRLASDPSGDGLRTLYRRYGGELYGFALNALRDRGLAEEVVQDAFLQLYPRFADIADPPAYLYRSVVNGCWSGHRRRKVADRFRHLTAVHDTATSDVDLTFGSLARLAPRARAAVVLRYYADFSVAEIAAALECPEGTVKSLIHRALAQLKDVIER